MKKCTGMISALLLVCSLGMFYACSVKDGEEPGEMGMIVLRIDSGSLQPLTVVPEVSMEVDHYVVIGTGPGTWSFQETVEEDSVLLPGIAVGSWTLEVEAWNDEEPSVKIGYGMTGAPVEVRVGEVTMATVTVYPLQGDGKLSIYLSWPGGAVESPEVEGELEDSVGDPATDSGDNPVSLVFVVDAGAGTAVSENNVVEAGYYLLTLRLKEGEELLWMQPVAVRILAVDDPATEVRINLVAEDIMGTIGLTITEELQDPIEIGFEGQREAMTPEQMMTVGAETTVGGEAVAVDRYRWYVHGEVRSEEETVDIYGSEHPDAQGAGYGYGRYRVDLVVWKDEIISSEYFHFEVVDVTIDAPMWVTATDGDFTDHVEINWEAVSGADHYNLYRSDTEFGQYDLMESGIMGTSTDDYGVMPGETYWYRVTAYDAVNDLESVPSDADSGYSYSGVLMELTGNVLDFYGYPGDGVYVYLYRDPEEILDPLDEVEIPVSSGAMLDYGDAPFSFFVVPGTYYLRAYRDAYGPDWSSQDGLPTLGFDAQAPLTNGIDVTVGTVNHDVTLYDTEWVDHYGGFQAYTYNESAEAEPPWTEVGGEESWGYGLVGGYYLKMDVMDYYDPYYTGTLSAPMVKVPTVVHEPAGIDPYDDIVALLDDGGASWQVGDNRNLSYDWMLNDNTYSFGIPDPDSSHAGDYVFHYTNTDSSQSYFHIQVDNIDPVVKLDRNIVLTYPTGAAALTSLNPTLTWTAVPDAAQYNISVQSVDGGMTYGEWNSTTTNSYTLMNPLVDDTAYMVRISVYDSIETWIDYDAYTESSDNMLFIVDVDGMDTVTISGSITNNSGASGDYLIQGSGNEEQNWGQQSAMVVDSSADSYSLAVFKDFSSQGYITFCIDVDGTGDPGTSVNESYSSIYYRELDCSSDVVVDINFNPPVFLLLPEDYARNTGNTPTFSWQDYSPSAPSGEWCYVFICMSDMADDFPEIVWSVSNAITSFDMSSPPAASLDLLDILGMGSSLLDLSSADSWQWDVGVAGYAYDDETGLLNITGPEGFYAESASRRLKTMP
jgi:hypothetical protein